MKTNFLTSVIFEYSRYKELAEKAVTQVKDADLHRSPGNDDNSIAIIMNHISGNLKSRFSDFLTSDGEKPWRQRDREFEAPELNRGELLKYWESGWEILFNSLDRLSDSDLADTVTIRSQELTVAEALHRSLAHTAYHVGQIVYLAKNIAGQNWNSLSIPKGKSEDFNSEAQSSKKKK